MELTECTCAEATGDRCIAVLAIKGNERRHYISSVGEYCCTVRVLDGREPRILGDVLIKPSAETLAAKEAVALAATEKLEAAAAKQLEFERIRAKRVAKEDLTVAEDHFLQDIMLGL